MKTYRKWYLDRVARLRERLSSTPLGVKRWVVVGVLFVVIVIILSLDVSPFGFLAEEGKPSSRTILAPRTIQYIDEARTDEQRQAAADAVQDVYIYDGKEKTTALEGLGEFFKTVSEIDALQLGVADKAQRIHSAHSSVPADAIERLLALTPQERQQVAASSEKVVSQVMDGRVTEESLKDASAKAKQLAAALGPSGDPHGIAGVLASSYVLPNYLLDRKETERRKSAARASVKHVITTKLQGEVIVNKGEVTSRDQFELLKSLGFQRPTFTTLNVLYIALFSLAILVAFGLYITKYNRIVYDSPGLLSVLGAIVLVYAVVAKVLNVAMSGWSPLWGYLMPCAAAAIIAAVLTDIGTAVATVVVCSMVTGVVTGGNFTITAFALLGGLLPAFLVSKGSTRHELRRAGLYSSFWLAFVALSTSVLTPIKPNLLLPPALGLLNGAICGIVAMGTLPFLETTFRVTTNPWLLELASPEQELLKELSVRAPGTYSHSVMVANMAEAAARAVGSDPMKARVAAYYHDVGKMKRPQFFVENQLPDSNPHDGISPNLSYLIITTHVKDGVETLEKYHLPPDIVKAVGQHHGTSVVQYFFDRAQKKGGKEIVEEGAFRYHLDKPQGRTAAILLLSDSVEAAARTLNNPSASVIEGMVDRIVNGKLEDGQLDESDLTLKDLRNIKKVFAKTLISTYHPRVDYPSTTVTGGKKKVAGKGKDGAPGAKEEHPAPAEGSETGDALGGATPSTGG